MISNEEIDAAIHSRATNDLAPILKEIAKQVLQAYYLGGKTVLQIIDQMVEIEKLGGE